MYSQRLVGILRLRSELERRKHVNILNTKSYPPIHTVRYWFSLSRSKLIVDGAIGC